MGRVIARKSSGAIGGIVLAVLMGAIMIFLGVWMGDISLYIFVPCGVLIFILTLVDIIKFISTPTEIIKVNSKNQLLLPRGVVVNLIEVREVAFKQARARAIRYSFGKVIIVTDNKKYKYDFVKECRQVAKEINNLRCGGIR